MKVGRASALSAAQERLWIFEKLRPGTRTYTMPIGYRLQGPLDAAALRSALGDVANRHHVLRSAFPSVGGRPQQVVNDDFVLPWSVIDVAAVPWADVVRLAEGEARTPFDVAAGPLLRACLLRMSPDDHILLVVLHHLVFDGWSLSIFMRELAVFYEARLAGGAAALPELPMQYADYAEWQRGWLSAAVLDELLGFWRTCLADAPPVLELPVDRPRPPVQSHHGAHEFAVIAPPVVTAMREACKRERLTPFMVLLAAYKVLLARYTGRHDIIVGTPIANRPRAEFEPLIGFFVNTLVLRTDLSGEPTALDVMRRVRDTALDAYSHQDLPFAELVKALKPARNAGWSPLVQTMFTVANTPGQQPQLPGLTIDAVAVEPGAAKFDMSLIVREGGDFAEAMIEYCTDLFDASTARRMLEDYVAVVGAMVREPHTRISELGVPATQR